jgi:UDP-N-acetylmuramoylalanine--D-glutamate ligase
MQDLVSYLTQKYQNKKILILGFGREGQSTFELLSKFANLENISVMDEHWQDSMAARFLLPPQVKEYSLDHLQQFDVIFKTPVIPKTLPQLQQFVASDKTLTSQMNELLGCLGSQIIGVTGTKGKSTTASLIAHLLNSSGRKAVLVGNIGKPAFDRYQEFTSETLIVAEISSYQLDSVTSSPHWAVWLNLFPEHLNYHGSFENYALAKAQITLHQQPQDHFFFNTDIPFISSFLKQSVAQQHPFSEANWSKQLRTLQVTNYQHLPSVVQAHNLLAAVLVARQIGLSSQQISQGLHTFTTLPHRLQNVGTFNHVTFIEDTLATIPQAAIAALEAFPETKVLMVGGYDRGIEFEPIVAEIVKRKVPYVIFFPESGKKMIQLLKEQYPVEQHPEYILVQNMEQAVEQAYQWLPDGGTVLLSPASPSFGQFKDYEDKAAQYLAAIQKFAPHFSSS